MSWFNKLASGILVALSLCTPAAAQNCSGFFPAGTICGNGGGSSAFPSAVAISGFGTTSIAYKPAVIVATTASITLSGTQTIDGVAVSVGQRVLVKNQATPSQNGIYVVASSAWARAIDSDATGEIAQGTQVYVNSGTVSAGLWYAITTADPITVGSTSLTFAVVPTTGTGSLVRATSPTFVTPTLGAALATTINGNAFTVGSYTVTGGAGKTFTFSNTYTTTANDGSTVAFGTGGTVTYTIASGAKALATSAIGPGACSAAQTDTATGAATTDVIDASFNGDPTGVTGYAPTTSGTLSIIAYPTSNTANFKVCNNTSGSITPGAITLNWRVRR